MMIMMMMMMVTKKKKKKKKGEEDVDDEKGKKKTSRKYRVHYRKRNNINNNNNNNNKTCSDLGAGRDGHDGHRLVVPDSLVNARRLTQVTAPGAAPTIKEAADDDDDDNGYSRSATQRAQQHCRHHVGSETPPRTARRIIFRMKYRPDEMRFEIRQALSVDKSGCA